MRRGFLIVGLCALAACANGLATRQAELSPWVGQPETALLQAMGAPDRFYQTGTMTYLTYEERDVEIENATPYYDIFGPSGWGRGSGPTERVYACDTTFTVEGGVVRSFTLRGAGCD